MYLLQDNPMQNLAMKIYISGCRVENSDTENIDKITKNFLNVVDISPIKILHCLVTATQY